MVTGVAAWPSVSPHKPRDGLVNLTIEALHTQDGLWSCWHNSTLFPARLSHQFLMLHSGNMPLADTAFFTSVMDYFIRSESSEAVVAAVALMMEETCSCRSSDESYTGDIASVITP